MQEELTHLSWGSTQRVVQGATDDSLVLNRSYAQQTSEEIVRVVEDECALISPSRGESMQAGAWWATRLQLFSHALPSIHPSAEKWNSRKGEDATCFQ
jgi:hypothetical protein